MKRASRLYQSLFRSRSTGYTVKVSIIKDNRGRLPSEKEPIGDERIRELRSGILVIDTINTIVTSPMRYLRIIAFNLRQGHERYRKFFVTRTTVNGTLIYSKSNWSHTIQY